MRLISFISVLIISFFANVTIAKDIAAAAVPASSVSMDSSGFTSGKVGLSCSSGSGKGLKLIIEKEGQKYTYNLKSTENYEYFPLQMGSGQYSITVFENISENNYRTIYSNIQNVEIPDSYKVFTGSIQEINWAMSSKAAVKARELTAGVEDNDIKIKLLYDFLVNNIKYDFRKLKDLKPGYLPDIDSTLESGKGICYDFSSVFAAMLRSIGIPAKLVKGYTDNVKSYHAWNEVYLESKGSWVIIDTSYDSQLNEKQKKVTMIKDEGHYKKQKEY